MKKVISIIKNNHSHWVGDGFPVRSIFTYLSLGKDISPFLLMDYAGPAVFPPSQHLRGVGEHPHRGFETVTIVYSGEVEHRDSAGGGGLIRPGDVQWMTAGKGLVHNEFHGKEFAKRGGTFEMVQLWVNLPQKFKMTEPRYQRIEDARIPTLTLPNEAGILRVIAGEIQTTKGPALTYSPVNLWDIRMSAGKKSTLSAPENHTAAIFVLKGRVSIDKAIVNEAEMALLQTEDSEFCIESLGEDAKILFLGGEPINDPIAGQGPFVMNTREELRQAFIDFQNGKMGTMKKIQGSD